MPVIKNLVGYMLGGPFFKPTIGDSWARSNISTMIWKTEDCACQMCDQTKVWTHVYKVHAKEIEIDISKTANDSLWLTNQATKLIVDSLVYDKTLRVHQH